MPRGVPYGPDQRRRIMLELQEWVDAKGYPPTVRELCAAVGWPTTSTSLMAFHLKVLEEQGHVQRTPNIARGLRILDRM